MFLKVFSIYIHYIIRINTYSSYNPFWAIEIIDATTTNKSNMLKADLQNEPAWKMKPSVITFKHISTVNTAVKM